MSAIAPITGRFKRGLYRDLVGSVTAGVGLGYWFWYSHAVPKSEKFKAFNEQNKQRILAEEQEWMKDNNYSRQ